MRKFKFFTVLKLVGVIMLCTGCGTAIDSASTAEVEKSVTTAADSIVENVVEVTDSAATTKKTTKATKTEKKKTKTTTTTTTAKKKEKEYVVYKPSTHYIHRSTCSWVNDECYKIDSTDGLEVLVCGDCNPDMEVKQFYTIPVETMPITETEPVEIITTQPIEETTTTTTTTEPEIEIEPEEDLTGVFVDDYSRQLLAEITSHEYGADWVSTEEKAKIVSGVMNRVYDDRFPNTVYDVLVAPGQFTGYTPGTVTPSEDCYAAVDYYFANQGEFDGSNSWFGDGYTNYFYYQ